MDAGGTPCGHHLRVLQRGASNVYFSHIVSSIYLPLWAEEISGDITAVLEQPHFWALFQQRTVGGKIDPIVCQTVASITGELGIVDQLKPINRQIGVFTQREGRTPLVPAFLMKAGVQNAAQQADDHPFLGIHSI